MKETFFNSIGSHFQKVKDGFEARAQASLPEKESAAIERISGLLPYGFEVAPGIFSVHDTDNLTVTALGYVIEISPLASCSENTADGLQSLLTADLPDQTALQFSIFATPDICWATLAYRYCRTSPEVLEGQAKACAQTLEELARARASYLTRLSREGVRESDHFRVRHFRGWLAVTVPLSTLKGVTNEAKTTSMKHLREKHFATLNSAHLNPGIWDADTLRRTVSELLNPQNAFAQFACDCKNADALDDKLDNRSYRSVNPLDAIAEQIVERDTQIAIDSEAIHFSHVGLEDKDSVSAIALSVNGYPSHYGLWQCLDWLGSRLESVPCPYLVTTIVAIGNAQKTRDRANLMAARSKQIAMSEVAHFLPYLKRRANDYDIVEAEYAQNGGLARVTHQVLIFAPKDKAVEAAAAARSVFKAAHLELSLDACMQWQGFLTSLPMTLTPKVTEDIYRAQRASTQTLSAISQMIPVLAEFTGLGARSGESALSPMLLLTGRHGQITPIDIFAGNENFNAVIVGSSGSGKSALTNDLITGNLGTGGKCYVIDVGGSYRKLCSLLGGQWIEYRREHPLVINPFELVTDLTEDEGLLIPILLEMAQPNPLNAETTETALKNHVTHLFHTRKPGETLSITTLVKSLQTGITNPTAQNIQTKPDQRILDIADSLTPYAEGGIYGEYFAGHSTVNFDADFIVLELEGLKSRKMLQSVILLCLIFMINRDLSEGDLSRHKMVVIDEAWDLLDHKHAAKFIEKGYRRARKQNASFITVTQSFADYIKNETTQAAFENAYWQFALRQRSDGLVAVEEKGLTHFSDWEKNAINSLKLQKDEYAECLFRMGSGGAAILQIRFDDFSRLLYSTRADDVSRINALINQGFAIDEAINEIVKQNKEKAYE